MTNMVGLSDDDVRDRFADILRAMVGDKKRFTWDFLARATGDKVRTLKSYVESGGGNHVPFHRAARVLTILGPEAWDMMIAPAGIATRPIDEGKTADYRRALTVLNQLSAEISEALEDGAVDHQEQGRIRKKTRSTLPTLAAIAGKG